MTRLTAASALVFSLLASAPRAAADDVSTFLAWNEAVLAHTPGQPDAAVQHVLDTLAKVTPAGSTVRHRIEHIETLPSDQVPRFAELGDLHQGIDDSAYSLDTLLEWAERDGLD